MLGLSARMAGQQPRAPTPMVLKAMSFTFTSSSMPSFYSHVTLPVGKF
jgi:hypothetical protein